MFFQDHELKLLSEVVFKAEDMVADHYKMSVSDWKKIRYDIKTGCELKEHEIVNGPFAQVVKYDAKPWGSLFASSVYTLYRICIQDDSILNRIEVYDLPKEAFFYYIVVHEFIHVVRFSKYIKKFEAEGDEMLEEEKIVHGLTREILDKNGINHREKVFEFFNNQLPY